MLEESLFIDGFHGKDDAVHVGDTHTAPLVDALATGTHGFPVVTVDGHTTVSVGVDATANVMICTVMLHPTKAVSMATADPMEKHMMKKSPENSSRIRHTMARMAHSCHMLLAK